MKKSSTHCAKVAVVGTGYFSAFHYDAWARLGVDLAGVCSLSATEAAKIAGKIPGCLPFTDVGEMLARVKPDILDIVVPPKSQLEIIRLAVERGIAMICQKPFTMSLEQAVIAAELADTASVPLIVHENFRFQPWHVKIRDMVLGGTIGEPFQVSFRMRPGDGQGPHAYLDRQPYFQKMERFLVHETAIHFIDVFRFLFGEVSAVTAHLSKLNPQIAGEDAGLIIFQFANGSRGLFDGNRLSDHIAKDRRKTIGDMMVEGSEGTIRLNGDGEIFLRKFGENRELPVFYEWKDLGFAGDSVFHTQQHILIGLTNGGPIMNTANDYIANLRVEEAIYRSDSTGRRVQLEIS